MPTLTDIVVDNIKVLAKANARARGVLLMTVIRHAYGDQPSYKRLVRGRGSITVRKYEECIAWLRDPANWPEGATIPEVDEPWRQSRPKPKEA